MTNEQLSAALRNKAVMRQVADDYGVTPAEFERMWAEMEALAKARFNP